MVWKSRSPYCHAVLRDKLRFHLDGSPSEERVDDNARSMAQARLDQLAARSAKLAAEGKAKIREKKKAA